MSNTARIAEVDNADGLEALRRRLDKSPMSRAQWAAVAVAFGISIVDGYDVISATFVLPALQQDWGLDPARLGVILAAGLFGMALGSLLVAPLADVFGRRPLVLAGLATSAVGLLFAAGSESLAQLIAWRWVTGLGIGAIMAVISSVAAEITNARQRPFAIALLVIGFPVGGVLAGLTATLLFPAYGWPIVFYMGCGLTAALIPAVLVFLPETLQSLLARDVPDRLVRVNALLARFGQPVIDHVPRPMRSRRSYAAIFAPGQRYTTIWIAIFQLLLMQTVLFILSWVPQLVSAAGASSTAASLSGTAASAAGIVGGLIFGAVATTQNVQRFTMFTVICLAAATATLGLVPSWPALFIGVAAFGGAFAYGSQAGFYTILPGCFQPEARATGTGFVLGLARFGSAASPLLAGGLLSAGLGRAAICACFAALALAASCLFLVKPVSPKMT